MQRLIALSRLGNLHDEAYGELHECHITDTCVTSTTISTTISVENVKVVAISIYYNGKIEITTGEIIDGKQSIIVKYYDLSDEIVQLEGARAPAQYIRAFIARQL
jgi:hypothetical protein